MLIVEKYHTFNTLISFTTHNIQNILQAYSNMEYRKLGKTGFKVSVITLGGCGPGFVSQEIADEAVKLALDYGINMLDIAPSYGEAETRLKPWIEKYRNKFFIAEKTTKRTKEEAWKELQQSLERTAADYFDSYQFHAVGTREELETILGKGGAMEAFSEAKETGIIKNIGITGHSNIEIFIEALERFDFDTVLLPVNVSAMTDPHPHNDFRPLLQIAKEKDIGIVAIKSVLKRRWVDDNRNYNTWYEPLDEPEMVSKAISYTLSQEGVTTIPLPCDVRLWKEVLDAGNKYTKMSQDEQKEFIDLAREYGNNPLFPISETNK